MALTLPQLQAAIVEWVAENFPGRTPKRLLIVTDQDDKPLALPVTVQPSGVAPARVLEPDGGTVFEPNDYQCRILEALEFRALRSDALIDELGGDRRRLWKPGGIKELVERDLVRLDRLKKLGYYRPDARPDELSEENAPP